MPRFRNPIVSTANIADGSITTAKLADAAVTSIKLAADLQSDNYVAGVSGWRIRRNTGDAEFNTVTLRGSLEVGSGGNFRSGPTTEERVQIPYTGSGFAGIPPIDFYGKPGVSVIHSLRLEVSDGGVGNPVIVQWRIGTDTVRASLTINRLGPPWSIWRTDRFLADAGSAGAPSIAFSGDPDTGLYLSGTNVLDVIAGAALQFRTGNSGNPGLQIIDGSESVPGLRFANDSSTGIHRTSGFFSISQGGSTGLLLSATQARLTNVSTDTTGSAANVFVTATLGRLQRVTSAARYKSRITRNVGYLAELELTPAKFYRRDDRRWFYGFIADDLGAQDRLLGLFGGDGQIEGFDTNALLAVMAAKINRLEANVAELAAA